MSKLMDEAIELLVQKRIKEAPMAKFADALKVAEEELFIHLNVNKQLFRVHLELEVALKRFLETFQREIQK